MAKGIIRNQEKLATTGLRRNTLDIIESGIRRVLPDTIIPMVISYDRCGGCLYVFQRRYPVPGRVFVFGGGKASGLMAQSLESVLGAGAITAGIVVEKAAMEDFATNKVRIVQGGHPIPDGRGEAAVREMLSMKRRYAVGGDDLILCLLSGGGSALLPLPAPGLTLADKQETTRLLISCGADIHEINSVRKHLSSVKGGRMARFFSPARVISLVLSDVTGNDLSIIASGPTFPDSSTYRDALEVLEKYGPIRSISEKVAAVIMEGCLGQREETPKTLDNADNYIIGDVRLALEAMAEEARRLGFRPLIISSGQTGDTADLARRMAGDILAGRYRGYNALLLGGETTLRLPPEHGRGGRNQHYAALTAYLLKDYPEEWVMASAGTDGSDFLAGVAGAIVDGTSYRRLASLGVDYLAFLDRCDSNTLLSLAGDCLIETGDTHTNVGDIIVYLLSDQRGG